MGLLPRYYAGCPWRTSVTSSPVRKDKDYVEEKKI